MKLKSIVLAAFSALVLSTGFASAATCMLSDVSGATACEEGSTNNDFLNPLQVNVDSMFGMTNWEYLSKDESPDGNFSVGTAYDMYMVVLKGAAAVGNYFGYKVDPGTSGTYTTPFDGQDISHVTIYGSGTPSEVPLPAAGFMLIAGLGGLALVRRRKSQV